MSESKTCETCKHYPDCCMWDCHPWNEAKFWEPKYEVVKQELIEANELLKRCFDFIGYHEEYKQGMLYKDVRDFISQAQEVIN